MSGCLQEISLACSGRDELARSVLNDEWVSHPTWASEEAGFVAHKKNINEDALHTCEQERHEYDVFIQANARTIAVLEPIWERIQEMTNEERGAYRLPADLGGPTKSLYVRVIKKVYGAAQWEEVWDALRSAPHVAVAVVLDRLHQKDEEWRREQRAWSRIWRGIEAKNYYKSLDHLGNNDQKNLEKKMITAKYLVNDIENRRKAQLKERALWDAEHKTQPQRRRWFAEGSVGYQLEYAFPDTSVLHDALKMIYSFLDHSQATYSQAERRAVETFLREFVPLLMMYPEAEFNAACGPLEPAHAEDSAVAVEAREEEDGVPAGALRRKLLATGAKDSREGSMASDIDGSKADDSDVWIRVSTLPTNNGVLPAKNMPFFANSTYYTLLRLIQVCSRVSFFLAVHSFTCVGSVLASADVQRDRSAADVFSIRVSKAAPDRCRTGDGRSEWAGGGARAGNGGAGQQRWCGERGAECAVHVSAGCMGKGV